MQTPVGAVDACTPSVTSCTSSSCARFHLFSRRWRWVSGSARSGEVTPALAAGHTASEHPSCPQHCAGMACPATRHTDCLCIASRRAARIPHLDSIAPRSHYIRTRNCTHQLFRVIPEGKCMLCYTPLLSASGSSNLFSCQHWIIKQHTEV